MLKDCKKIEINQEYSEVEQFMSEYIDSSRVDVGYRDQGTIPLQPEIRYEKALGLQTTSLTDVIQCNIYFVKDRVVHVQTIGD